ncbi:NAD(P)/FAD-dependent oxidoreductase [Actinokineospora enzanensis]|uniref:NAD(P)/FAD-dependent oxidoreductase n=1 Tax=Actinokineospora enzanensis TaxID=155975 RepID=UPI000369F570|nr:FAD-dependent oxidoreductase [Actinokineospora enzanensis]
MTADVTIVGGGILGCVIARELADRLPGARLVVLDQDMVGSGASRRSAGLHIPRGATGRVRRMTSYSQAWYERLLAGHPELPIRPVDMFVVGSGEDPPAAYVDDARLEPFDGPREHVPTGARMWRAHGAQYADVYQLTRALAAGLRDRVEIRESARVNALESTSDGVVVRLDSGERVVSRRLVLAPGPWLSSGAWRDLVAPLGARVKKVVALHVDGPVPPDAGVVVYEDVDAFLLPLRNAGHWLFSYTCQEWDVDPATVACGLSTHDIEEAGRALRDCAPSLVDRNGSGRVFCDAYSTTREPLVTALADDRVVFAGAANGSGYRLAPAIADEVAELLVPAPHR